MDHGSQSDDALIALAPKDPSAFAVLYRRHSEAVFRYSSTGRARASRPPT
jgi:hypothetical protein